MSLFKYLIDRSGVPTLMIKGHDSQFKTEPVDILTFAREFLSRRLSEPQQTVLTAIVGSDPTRISIDKQMVVAAVGQGGGKNYTFETLVSYYAYWITNLIDPFTYIPSLTGNDPLDRSRNIDIGNSTLVNKEQAERAFFVNAKNAIVSTKDPATGDNWFERYAGLNIDKAFNEPEIDYYQVGKKKQIKNQSIEFPPLRRGEGSLRLISFDSTATSPEGYSFILGIVDEISRADSKATYLKAKKLVNMYEGNNVSRFGRLGKTLMFSYLNTSQFDLTHEYLKRYEEERRQGIKTGLIAFRFSTFEFNPNRTEAEFIDKRSKDPVEYDARYLCQKAGGHNQFFAPYQTKIRAMMSHGVEPAVIWTKTVSSRPDNKGGIANYSALQLERIKGDNRPRAFAIDSSINQDGFTIVGGYSEPVDPYREEIFLDAREPELVAFNRIPIIDTILKWKPDRDHPVDYLNVADMISHILTAFPNTYAIDSDRYQSEKLRQEIERRGVSSTCHLFSRKQQERLYKRMRIQVWSDRIRCLADDDLDRELTELILDKGRIDHPDGGSKDVGDALALSVDLLNRYSEFVPGGSSIDSEPAMKRLIEQYILHRHNLRQSGVNESHPEHIHRLADLMGVTIREALIIRKQVEAYYPNS